MGRPRDSFNKKDLEKQKIQKRKEKEQKKEFRKANSGKGKGLDDMLAYVDAYGNIVSAPPDPGDVEEIKLEDIRISISKKEDLDPPKPYKEGTVTFYNQMKGFGFIKDADSQQSVFFHVNDLVNPVQEGTKVYFETEKGPKGLNAVRVRTSP